MKDICFSSEIIEKGSGEKGLFVILKENPFYPDGKGGQIGDRGTISGANVLSSEEKGGKVLIYVDKFPENKTVSCRIDGERRHTISALHTAQHILSAVLEDTFNVKTVAFHMSEDSCTIDVSPSVISQSVLEKAENMANEIVFSNLPVKKYFAKEDDISSLNLRSKHKVSGKIRIVEIPGVDSSMCGGTHVDFTGEIGIIKIVKTEKIKKQFLRIYFTAEKRTLAEFQKLLSLVNSVSGTLTCGADELPLKINKMLSEVKTLKKENKVLKLSFIKNIESELFHSQGAFVSQEVNIAKGDFMTLLAMLSREKTDKMFLIYSNKERILGISKGTENSIDLQLAFSGLFKTSGAKGVIKPTFLFEEFSTPENFENALQLIKTQSLK